MALEKVCYRSKNSKWYDRLPASPAVRVDDLLYIAGQVALDAAFRPLALGDVKEQAKYAFERIGELIEMAGGTMDDVIDMISFHKDPRDMDTVFDVARDYIKGDYPAWTAVGTLGSYRSEVLVSIRAIAHLGKTKKVCYTPGTLKWWRDYPMSGGCKKGDLLFVSGQVGADADGYVTTPGDHAGQARYAINRIREIVEMAGGTMDDVIDLLAFHQDVRGMDPAVDVWCREVVDDIPFETAAAVTTIGTQGLYKLGMLGAFRAIADLSPGKRVAKTPPSIWWHILPISGGTRKAGGKLIAISGEVASDGDGNITTPGDTAAQARYAFNRIREVLEGFDASMDNVVEIISFHKDPRAWEIVMSVGEQYFSKEKGPAWTPVGTTGLYKEGYLHEIYALAMV
jgi:enamine deaminase RidA (YjgF/YER057c/UK114 family)